MEFSEGSMVKRLRCGHIFDPECIDTWLRKKNACPMCKRAVVVRRPAPRCHIILALRVSQSAFRVPRSRLSLSQSLGSCVPCIPLDSNSVRQR